MTTPPQNSINSPRDLLVFEHIPKTAGSTMYKILWRLYSRQRVFVLKGRHRQRIEVLRRCLQEPDNNLCAISSHAGFGFHERLPAGYRYTHFTLLRDPIERVLSHYYHVLQQQRLDPSTSLEAFVQDNLGRACNVQTAFLGGLAMKHHLDGLTYSLDLYTEELLEQAKANLRRMAVIGLTERFDESLLLFRKTFGWKWSRVFYVRRNTGQVRPKHPNVPASTLVLLRRYNELDLELYRYAQDLVEGSLAPQLPHMARDLSVFRHLNAAYGKVFQRVYPLARPVVHSIRALNKQRKA